ncbi:MAG: hypothetical protein U0M42_02915 [Acutalibacteraceae bacterium]|nr:hypothetical protein [Acutalibacteraceae bacterium]
MYYDVLLKNLSSFFEENEITALEDGSFGAKDKKFKISYNEQNKCYELSFAEENGEFSVISSYLFDETQREKDVESVAIDFTETLRKQLSIAKKRVASSVSLPTSDSGENATLSGLTQKLLAFFPQNKEIYKTEVANQGRFLATKFYKEYFIPDIKALLSSGNKKQIKKFYDAMTEIFINGDEETVTFTVACISAAVYDSEELKETAKAQTTDCASFYSNIYHFCGQLKSDKKLRATLIK